MYDFVCLGSFTLNLFLCWILYLGVPLYHMSLPMCQLSPVTCHLSLSPIKCHLSLTLTATRQWPTANKPFLCYLPQLCTAGCFKSPYTSHKSQIVWNKVFSKSKIWMCYRNKRSRAIGMCNNILRNNIGYNCTKKGLKCV